MMDDYERLWKMGSGGQGNVYRVRHKKNQREYALKIISCRDSSQANYALKEVKVLMELKHKNIVTYVDFFIHFGSGREVSVCFVMELCSSDLMQKIGDGKRYFIEHGNVLFSERLVLHWLQGCASALDHLHAAGFLHRDLKPTNIFFTTGDDVRLGDFGLATTVGMGRVSAVGTPYYFAPELMLQKRYDNKIDIWGLGVVFLETLTLKERPINSEVLVDPSAADSVVRDITDFGYSTRLATCVRSMLQASPNARPTARQVLVDLGLLSEPDRPLKMQPATDFMRGSSAVKRNGGDNGSPPHLQVPQQGCGKPPLGHVPIKEVQNKAGQSPPSRPANACEMCELAEAAVHCRECDEQFCNTCDARQHRHRNRIAHCRTTLAVDKKNDTKSSPTRLCDLCGGVPAEISCDDCCELFCAECDSTKHKNAKRARHVRCKALPIQLKQCRNAWKHTPMKQQQQQRQESGSPENNPTTSPELANTNTNDKAKPSSRGGSPLTAILQGSDRAGDLLGLKAAKPSNDEDANREVSPEHISFGMKASSGHQSPMPAQTAAGDPSLFLPSPIANDENYPPPVMQLEDESTDLDEPEQQQQNAPMGRLDFCEGAGKVPTTAANDVEDKGGAMQQEASSPVVQNSTNYDDQREDEEMKSPEIVIEQPSNRTTVDHVTGAADNKHEPRTFMVPSTDCPTIADAVRQAVPGSTIRVGPGVYTEPIVVACDDLTIVGTGQPRIMVSGAATAVRLEAGGGCFVGFDITQKRGVLASSDGNSRSNMQRKIEKGTSVGGSSKEKHHALEIVGGSWAVSRCTVSSESGAGIAVVGDGVDPQVSNCTVSDSKQGILVAHGGRGTFTNNVVSNNHHAGLLVRHEGSPKFSGNRVIESKETGVFICHGSNGVIEHNVISNHGGCGIVVKGECSPIIRRNVVSGNKQAGMFFSDRAKGTVGDNDIHHNAKAGVLVKTLANPNVIRNKIYEGRETGIYVFDKGTGTFTDNEIYRNVNAGILVTTGGNPTVVGNRLGHNKYEGVWVCKQGRGRFERNDVRGNSKGAKDLEDPTMIVWAADNREV